MKKIATATVLGASLCLSLPTWAAETTDDSELLMEQVVELLLLQQEEIEGLKKRLSETNEKVVSSEEKIAETARVAEAAASRQQSSGAASWAERTHIGGYGELHYNNNKNGKTDKVDNHRFVLFVEHEFSDDVRFVSEVELENSISGDGEEGEIEIEQAYIEWDYTEGHLAKIGQFLIPVGIINETHEPDTFYGVERNPVEKNIIPATWWEAGVSFGGELSPGLSYDVAVHSGLETPTSGSDAYKVRKGRQKVSKATAEEFAYTARLKYKGIAGLEVAASVQRQDDIAQGLGANKASAMMLEGHAIYQLQDLTLRGLYATWDVDGAEAKAAGRDEQDGWYFEPSYRISSKVGVFARYSEWDNNAGDNSDTEVEQVDVGLNYWIVDNVALKVDWADQKNGDGDSFNVGLGFSF